MTKDERNQRDLEYLRNFEEPDMSPEAITDRMHRMGELCDIAMLLGLPDIEYFQVNYRLLHESNN